MSYIQPNSTIIICKDVPLDIDYKNTIYFTSKTEQYNYFRSKARAVIDRNTYVRVNNNVVRIEGNAELYYDCNYLMFKNTIHDVVYQTPEKWYYAFITNVEYINDNVTEITFELDEIQTWFFELEYEDVMIERQHTTTDNIGDNLTDETVELGDYVTAGNTRSGYFSSYSIVVLRAIGEEDSGYNTKYMLGGIPMGLTLQIYNEDATTGFKTFFDEMKAVTRSGKDESIIAMYLFPTALLPSSPEAGAGSIYKNYPQENVPLLPPVIGGSYAPKNKKLFTYPYCYLSCETADTALQFKYERFSGNPSFKILASIASSPEAVIVPMNYENVNGELFTKSLSITDFPMVAYSIDAYRAWVAQGGLFKAGMGIVGGAISNVVGAATLNPTALVAGTGAIVTSVASQYIASKCTPDRANGTPTGSAFVGNRTLDFRLKCNTITAEFARKIDEYFSRYGYAIGEIRKPNIHARARYTYVKTINSHFGGAIPATAESKISDIFDNGITFWCEKNSDGEYLVGRYTDSNGNLLANNVL